MIHGRRVDALPKKAISPFQGSIVSAYTGPNSGFTKVDLHSNTLPKSDEPEIAGCSNWNCPSAFAYGIALSLYEEDKTRTVAQMVGGVTVEKPVILGEPVADVFAVSVREKSAVLAVADGVNWGKNARFAARCAVFAVMEHIASSLERIKADPNTHVIGELLLESVKTKAQDLILKKRATLTTLSAAVVCETTTRGEWALVTVAVGDSPVYVYCPHEKKAVEVTVGCHPHDGARDMRMAGGVLGPSYGTRADLSNLTVAYTPVYPGDIVILATDGVSDNFSSQVMSLTEPNYVATDMKPCCENVVHISSTLRKHQDQLRHHMTAQTVAACLINHAVEVTEQKRLLRSYCIDENIDMRREARTNPEFAARLNSTPGKLDHATVVCYQVGLHSSLSSL